ncbi:hypothetical protein M514_15282 [Trichuris suis]|uniref:Uncharacterized protein n=1 Tax=Trichuris suis TaxID=68888 RepID=A0A085NSK0_9BILA|nr:hypothetical protein M514_15282 [Trichuris suis]
MYSKDNERSFFSSLFKLIDKPVWKRTSKIPEEVIFHWLEHFPAEGELIICSPVGLLGKDRIFQGNMLVIVSLENVLPFPRHFNEGNPKRQEERVLAKAGSKRPTGKAAAALLNRLGRPVQSLNFPRNMQIICTVDRLN